MYSKMCFAFMGLLLFVSAVPAAGPADSVVKVTASVRYPSLVRPWTKTSPVEMIGTGVVIDNKRILTCAHLVLYANEVHVQAGLGGVKVTAKVAVIGSDVDLALLTLEDDSFFKKAPPLARAKKLPSLQDNVSLFGFPIGGNEMSITKGVVSRIDFGLYDAHNWGLYLQVTAAINPGNSGGPAVVNDTMVGIAASRLKEAENIGYIISTEEIELFLKNIRNGKYEPRPFESAGTGFQTLQNEALLRKMKIDRSTRGILICPPQHPPAGYQLREFDVLAKLGDHEIDNDGMITLASNQRISFHYLFSRAASETWIPAIVIRNGQKNDVRLGITRRNDQLIPELMGGQPSYFIHGPMVLASLKEEAISMYERMNPTLFLRPSPLVTRRADRPRFDGEELVVLTAPLFNHRTSKGYHHPVGVPLKDLNGTPIKNLRHLVEMLRDCSEEYLTFRFADDPSSVMVFNRKDVGDATAEILEDNGIAPSRRGSSDMLQLWKKDVARPK